MKKAKITIVGSLVYDLVAKADRRPQKGESLLGNYFGMFPGGKGANQAVQAAKLGADVVMCGRVGNDFFGEELIKNLKKEGVNTKYIIKDKTTTTAVGCIVIDKEGDNSIVMVPQANMKMTKKDVDNVKGIIAKSDILLMQLEIPQDVINYAAKIAHKNKIKIILNPAPARKVPDFLLKMADVLTPSEIEAQILTDTKNEENATEVLLKKGVKNLIITLGEKGAMYLTKDKRIHFPAFKVKAVDTTAAGDAFSGALSVALAEGKDIKEAIGFANAAGALCVTKMGAQPSLSTRDEVEKLLRSVKR